MISSGKPSNCKNMFNTKVSEADVLGFYLGIDRIPTVIASPFRQDLKPSLSLYSPDGIKVNYIDFGTNERGSSITLLMKLWNLDYNATIDKIVNDLVRGNHTHSVEFKKCYPCTHNVIVNSSKIELKCKVREWRNYDIEYWDSYGINLEWLKWANVYPVSHKIIVKDNKEMVFRADKYCYVFVEFKEGRTTMKFYQPFNTRGYKWQTNHDKSVLGLWDKMPEKGKAVCICSSVKDALCLMSNIYIPCICLQGEGYPISNTAVRELKRRFTDIIITLDSDETGLKDAEKLSLETGFRMANSPIMEKGKDWSDLYYYYGKNIFIKKAKEILGV